MDNPRRQPESADEPPSSMEKICLAVAGVGFIATDAILVLTRVIEFRSIPSGLLLAAGTGLAVTSAKLLQEDLQETEMEERDGED